MFTNRIGFALTGKGELIMIDRAKVIKGLKCCLTLDSPCGDCPYYSYEDIQELECERNLRNDALALLKEHDELLHKKQHDVDRLCNEISEWKHKFHDKLLKEQEAVAPRISESHRTQSGRMSRRRAWCGACGLGIRIGSNKQDRSNYCERCGRAVKWDA